MSCSSQIIKFSSRTPEVESLSSTLKKENLTDGKDNVVIFREKPVWVSDKEAKNFLSQLQSPPAETLQFQFTTCAPLAVRHYSVFLSNDAGLKAFFASLAGTEAGDSSRILSRLAAQGFTQDDVLHWITLYKASDPKHIQLLVWAMESAQEAKLSETAVKAVSKMINRTVRYFKAGNRENPITRKLNFLDMAFHIQTLVWISRYEKTVKDHFKKTEWENLPLPPQRAATLRTMLVEGKILTLYEPDAFHTQDFGAQYSTDINLLVYDEEALKVFQDKNQWYQLEPTAVHELTHAGDDLLHLVNESARMEARAFFSEALRPVIEVGVQKARTHSMEPRRLHEFPGHGMNLQRIEKRLGKPFRDWLTNIYFNPDYKDEAIRIADQAYQAQQGKQKASYHLDSLATSFASYGGVKFFLKVFDYLETEHSPIVVDPTWSQMSFSSWTSLKLNTHGEVESQTKVFVLNKSTYDDCERTIRESLSVLQQKRDQMRVQKERIPASLNKAYRSLQEQAVYYFLFRAIRDSSFNKQVFFKDVLVPLLSWKTNSLIIMGDGIPSH